MTVLDATRPMSWQGLFLRLATELDHREGREWDPVESEIQSAVYLDPTRYDAEMARLFSRLPLCVGHADQLNEPDSVLARDIAGVPLLLTRAPDRTIGVFLNACRHRGTRLVAKDGELCRHSSLSCLYHGWTYDLTGALVSVPRREAFPTLDTTARGLRRLPSAVHHGLIWVVLDPQLNNMPDIAAYLVTSTGIWPRSASADIVFSVSMRSSAPQTGN